MRIITLNCNGIRAAERKGFFTWLKRQNADVVCLQELKAKPEQLQKDSFFPKGCFVRYFSAQRPGYSGVGLISRKMPDRVHEGIGIEEFDQEGRYLECQFGDLKIASLYLPSGSSSPERQASKDRFLEAFLPKLKQLRSDQGETIVCGDWNIAHRAIDLKNWKSNQKNSGFLPHEREWMDRVFREADFVDAFRVINPHPNYYTWWSNRGRAWENNVGWRIDYQVATSGLRPRVSRAQIFTQKRFSDHAPLTMDYELPF